MTLQAEHFDKLVSLSGDLFFSLEHSGVIKACTSSVSQELGHSVQDFVSKNFAHFVDPAEMLAWEKSLQIAVASPFPHEFAVRFRNATRNYVQMHGRICFLSDSKTYLVTLRKLSTAEEKLPQVLQKTLDQLNLSLKSAQMGIWEVHLPVDRNPAGIRLKWDDEMHRIHGAPLDPNIVPMEWFYKHVYPEDLPAMTESTTRFLASPHDKVLHFNYRVAWPNGETHHIDMFGSIDRSSSEALKLYGVAKDVTQEVLKQKIFADQKNRMISSSRMAVLGEISGGIAHEINNPLTVIQARSFQLMQMAEQNVFDAAKVRAAADSISKTGDKIAKIVKSLRAFAHSQENVPVDTVSVLELIQETLDFCKVRFYNHGIELRIAEIPVELEIECRLIQIEEVLLNLFNNAHDAIIDLPQKWIFIEAFDKDEEVEIIVTDSGPGIAESIADNMMMPFFTTKEIGRGMGLGLSIVSDIVNKHHGQISLDRSHTNTRFVLRLPKCQHD
jgi:signal transduction histidine kinase